MPEAHTHRGIQQSPQEVSPKLVPAFKAQTMTQCLTPSSHVYLSRVPPSKCSVPVVWCQCDRQRRVLPARAIHSQGEAYALTQKRTITDTKWNNRALTCSVSYADGSGRELGSWEGSAGMTAWGGLPFQQGTLRGGLCTEKPLSLLAGPPAWHLTQHEWTCIHPCKCPHASQGVPP